jgi:hypothetical protein
MTDIVFARDGSVAKIIGDSLHVPFGTPSDQPDHATRAVACSLELDAFACSFREHCQRKTNLTWPHAHWSSRRNRRRWQFRRRKFFDYSAYSDTINVAARLVAKRSLRPITHCVRLRPSQSMRRLEVMSTLVPLTTDVLSCMRCRLLRSKQAFLLSASYPSSG